MIENDFTTYSFQYFWDFQLTIDLNWLTNCDLSAANLYSNAEGKKYHFLRITFVDRGQWRYENIKSLIFQSGYMDVFYVRHFLLYFLIQIHTWLNKSMKLQIKNRKEVLKNRNLHCIIWSRVEYQSNKTDKNYLNMVICKNVVILEIWTNLFETPEPILGVNYV